MRGCRQPGPRVVYRHAMFGAYPGWGNAILPAKLGHGESTGRRLGNEVLVQTVGNLLGRDLPPRKPARRPKTEGLDGR